MPRRTDAHGRLLARLAAGLLVLTGALALPSSAAAEQYVLLDGPHAGKIVDADKNGATDPRRASGLGAGDITPQEGSCNYQWGGNAGGVPASACAARLNELSDAYSAVAFAINGELQALQLTSANRPTREELKEAVQGPLQEALNNLTAWQIAINAETSGATKTTLTAHRADAQSRDEQAKQKLLQAMDSGGQARRQLIDDARILIGQALGFKVDGFGLVVEAAPIAGEVSTDPDSLPAPENLTAGTALEIQDPDHVLGAHDPGTASSEGFLANGVVGDLPGTLPTEPHALGPNGTVMGQQGALPSGPFPSFWAPTTPGEFDFFFSQIGTRPGSVLAGNGDGGVGYRITGAGEVATWYREAFDGADPGFRPVTIGDFPGGAALFAIDDSFTTPSSGRTAYGDFFLSGSGGPFRAFAVNLRTENATNLFRPQGGSSQPRTANDLMAAGGVVNADSSIEGVFFYGRRHRLPYAKLPQNTLINDVNEAGVAVGTIGSDAALFAEGEAIDLNTLIPDASGWDLDRANGIDDAGNIVGTGTIGGMQRAFLLRGGADPLENDLSLVKTLKDPPAGTPPGYKKGQAVHFVLTLVNHGPHEAKDVKVVDHIPKGCKFVRATADKGGKPIVTTVATKGKKENQGVKLTAPGEGEDGGDVTLTFDKIPAPVPPQTSVTRTIHIVCKAAAGAQQTDTNKAELSTGPAQKEPNPDPHPNTLEVQYVLKP